MPMSRARQQDRSRLEREARRELADLVSRYREIVSNPPRADEWRPRRPARSFS